MNKHTPGPWTARATPNDCDFAYEIDGVASVYRGGGAANASLIAAAPELLEACELALEALDGAPTRFSQEHVKAIIVLREAIRKAEGWR